MLEYRDSLNSSQFLTNFCLSLKHRYLYAPVPKAAHSTLKLLLSQVEIQGLPVGISELNVHQILASPFVHFYQLPDYLIDEVTQSQEFFRFAIVRDPYDRIVSCYIDKILRGSPERHVISLSLGKPDGDPISFLEFLQVIATQKLSAMDMHWKPQSAILLWERISYDFIGRMESFAADVDVIFRRIIGKSAAETVKVQSVRHHATNATSVTKDYLRDPEAKELIQQLYCEDFSAFSYERR